MNPVVKEKWITALKSGKYQQGRGQLRSFNDKFCCLGVLCDILVNEYPDKFKWTSSTGRTSYYINDAYEPFILSSDVTSFLNIYFNPRIKGISLSDYNDDLNFNFDEIADLISYATNEELENVIIDKHDT
jgi:hypothetical protein